MPRPNGKTYKQLTQEDKNRIIEAYKQGIPMKEMPKATGVTLRTIRQVLVESGFTLRRKNRYTLDESWFDEIDSQEKAYYLGLLFADGMADPKTNQIVISQMEGREAIVYRFKDLIQYTGEVVKTKCNGGFKNRHQQYRINFSSERMCRALNNLGIVPGRAYVVTDLPPISEDLIRHFLRGYWDGDGSIWWTTLRVKRGYGQRTYEYPTCEATFLGNRELLEKIEAYLAKHGISSSYKASNSKGLYYLRISGGNNLRNLYHLLYDGATVLIEDKHAKWLPLFTTSPSMEQSMDANPEYAGKPLEPAVR